MHYDTNLWVATGLPTRSRYTGNISNMYYAKSRTCQPEDSTWVNFIQDHYITYVYNVTLDQIESIAKSNLAPYKN